MSRCDITDRVAVDALVDRAGPLWGVVHAAALCGGSGPFESIEEVTFTRYLHINLTEAFHVVRVEVDDHRRSVAVAAPPMGACSTHFVAQRHAAPYVAAKGGLRMLVKAAAVDLARHEIAVSLIHPGPILVPRNAEPLGDEGVRTQFRSRVPMGGPGDPAAVAAAASYLLDPEATYTTGTEIAVDGGATSAF